MPRIHPVPDHDARGRSRELIESLKTKLGTCPNIYRTLAHSPAALEGVLHLTQSLTGTSISGQDRERIALLSAQLNRCGYCLSAHTLIGGMSGLSGEEIEAARKGESTDPKSQAMLSLAQSIIATQGNVPDDALVAARTANLSEAEIVETVVVVAMNILTNFFNHVADTEIDFPQVTV
jgi:uncharacterized peroxidase-related enzyme